MDNFRLPKLIRLINRWRKLEHKYSLLFRFIPKKWIQIVIEIDQLFKQLKVLPQLHNHSNEVYLNFLQQYTNLESLLFNITTSTLKLFREAVSQKFLPMLKVIVLPPKQIDERELIIKISNRTVLEDYGPTLNSALLSLTYRIMFRYVTKNVKIETDDSRYFIRIFDCLKPVSIRSIDKLKLYSVSIYM